MTDLLPHLVIGITAGSVYALAGMGLVLTFKTSGIFNFAHGAQAALAAYLMFELWERNGVPWPLAAAVVLLVAGVGAGLVLERLALALAATSTAARVAATVGLLVAIQGVLVVIFGPATIPMRFFLPSRLVEVGSVNVRVEQIIVTAVVLGAAIGLYLFFTRSRLGVAMQAVVDDPMLLALSGTSPARVRRYGWIIGSSFAALSGMLLAPTVGLDPAILTLLVFFAFGAAAVGSFTSLPLTYAGGLVIGVAASLVTSYLDLKGPVASLPSTLPFIVLFVALLATPAHRLVERGTGAVRRAAPPVRFAPGTVRLATGLGAAVLVVIPHVVGVRVGYYTTALASVILFASLSLLVRTAGQISLCQMSFAAVGAATFAHAVGAGFPWPVAVVAGGLVAVPVGALVAVPAIRLSGVYLAIATFGFGLLLERLFFPSFLLFGSASRVLAAPRPQIGWLHTRTDTGYFYVVLAVMVACWGLVGSVRRGRLGRLLHGLGDAPIVLDAHGTDTNITRLILFCLAAFLAGVAGAVAAPVTGLANGSSFGFNGSLLLVAVLLIAGRQPVLGPLVAALLYTIVPAYITNDTALRYLPVMFGAGALVAAMLGGVPLFRRLAATKRTGERVGRSPVRTRTATAAPAGAREVTA